jgi:hypothetical protein
MTEQAQQPQQDTAAETTDAGFTEVTAPAPAKPDALQTMLALLDKNDTRQGVAARRRQQQIRKVEITKMEDELATYNAAITNLRGDKPVLQAGQISSALKALDVETLAEGFVSTVASAYTNQRNAGGDTATEQEVVGFKTVVVSQLKRVAAGAKSLEEVIRELPAFAAQVLPEVGQTSSEGANRAAKRLIEAENERQAALRLREREDMVADATLVISNYFGQPEKDAEPTVQQQATAEAVGQLVARATRNAADAEAELQEANATRVQSQLTGARALLGADIDGHWGIKRAFKRMTIYGEVSRAVDQARAGAIAEAQSEAAATAAEAIEAAKTVFLADGASEAEADAVLAGVDATLEAPRAQQLLTKVAQLHGKTTGSLWDAVFAPAKFAETVPYLPKLVAARTAEAAPSND